MMPDHVGHELKVGFCIGMAGAVGAGFGDTGGVVLGNRGRLGSSAGGFSRSGTTCSQQGGRQSGGGSTGM